jgi:hypothetical protein
MEKIITPFKAMVLGDLLEEIFSRLSGIGNNLITYYTEMI